MTVREQSTHNNSTLGSKVQKQGLRVSNMRVYNESQAAVKTASNTLRNNFLGSPNSPKSAKRQSSLRSHNQTTANTNEQIKSHPELLAPSQVSKMQNMSSTSINQAPQNGLKPAKKRKLTLTQRTINQGFSQSSSTVQQQH